jgi:phospholipase/lecithinase/hemolysin
MKTRRSKKRLMGIALTFLFLLPIWAAAQTSRSSPYAGMVVFGDSLSDPGNHFIEFGTTSLQPFAPIPDASYAIGGHHFTNGATWVERMATALLMPGRGGPAFRTPGVFTNYAFGRARSRPCASVPAVCESGEYPFSVVDLSFEVGQFLSDSGGSAPSEDLYVMWIGANDLNDALSALAIDSSLATSQAIIGAAVLAEVGNIQALYGAGARTFLIPTAPNFALSPLVRPLDPPVPYLATLFAGGYDAALGQALDQLKSNLPGINFIRFNANAVFEQIMSDPAAFGMSDALNSCLTFGVTGNAICSTPNQHLFWDGIHPTTAGHSWVAAAALEALAP